MSGLSIAELERKYHTEPGRVGRALRAKGVKIRAARNQFNRPYTFHTRYFQTIDSHTKAYVLGLMFSDGNVNLQSFGASFCSVDLELVEFVKAQLSLTKEIYRHKAAGGWVIQFHDEQTKNDLIRVGCTPQKSLTKEFPTEEQVPREFVDSFILGYFDGNGCISGRRQQVKFYSSTRFCHGLVAYLQSQGIATCKVTEDSNPSSSYFRIGEQRSIDALAELMYRNCPFSLGRKRERFANVSCP